MLMRFLEIASYYNSMDGLLRAKFAYQGVNFRNVIMPSAAVGGSRKPFNEDKAWTDATWQLGFDDAQKVAANPTQNLDDMIHFHALKKSGNL